MKRRANDTESQNEKRDEVLRRMLNTPPQPHKSSKTKSNDPDKGERAKG